MTVENPTGRARRRLLSAWVWALLFLISLSACAPPGARNWPFSIGPQTYGAALGDLDGDGDLDAFLANGENEVPVPNTVWLNDGEGNFTDSGQQLGNAESRHVLLVDIDLDGDLDAVVSDTGPITLYLNDGRGEFVSSRNLGNPDMGNYVMGPSAGDVNGDGYPDVFAGGCCGGVEMWDDGRRLVHPPVDYLWFSDGQGGFVDSAQTFDLYGTNAVALGDLDGNGHPDAFFGNAASNMDQSEAFIHNQPNTIWFNDSKGRFSDSGQRLGESETASVALGDLDGDGDLDAFVGNEFQADEIWLNTGGSQGGETGRFILASTVGYAKRTRSIALADLDGDGDLDALTTYCDSAQSWINSGPARFTVGQQLTFTPYHALALGDLDGDGRVDIFAGSVNHGLLVWFNNGEVRFTRK